MTTHKLNHWLTLAVPLLGGTFLVSQPAQAQYYNPAQQYPANIAQSVASGLLTPGQAANLANRQNSLSQRAARLLRNDGGVLTPNDASKIARAERQDNQIYSNDVASNMNRGTGGGGFFGNLFGTTPTGTYLPSAGLMPASTLVPVTNYGYTSPYVGSYAPYPVSTGVYNSTYTAPTPVYTPSAAQLQQQQARRAYYRQLHGL